MKVPQYIFDKVTDLIVNTFTFEKTEGDYIAEEEFSKKEIFSKVSGGYHPIQISELHNRIVAPLRIEGTLRNLVLWSMLTLRKLQKSLQNGSLPFSLGSAVVTAQMAYSLLLWLISFT